MSDCITAEDPDQMGQAIEIALDAKDIAALAAIVSYYRAQAAEANGRLAEVNRSIAAKDETIRILTRTLSHYISEVSE